jgi:hypothetical protein
MKRPRSYISSNAQITSFRLLLYVTEGAMLPYFQYYSILLVHDWYYMQVYWRDLAPIFPVMLRLLVSYYYSMLPKGPRSHTYSNAQTTSFQLVFYVTEGVSLPYFQ